MAEGQGVRSLNRGLRVLELIGDMQPAGVSDIARALGEPKSSIQRVLQTLERAGWVARSNGLDPGWVLTQRVARLGGQVGGDLNLRNVALPVMERLRRQTNETIHLALAEPPSMLLIERLESTHPVRYVEALGGLAPMALTATGRASLSTMPIEMARTIVETDPSVEDVATVVRIMSLIEQATQVGYATTSDWRDGVLATAAAVRWDGGPVPPPALSISAPLSRMDDEARQRHAELVVQAAGEIQRQL